MPMFRKARRSVDDIYAEAPDRELADIIIDLLPDTCWGSQGIVDEELAEVAEADIDSDVTFAAGDVNLGELIKQLEQRGRTYERCQQDGCSGILLHDVHGVPDACVVCGTPAAQATASEEH